MSKLWVSVDYVVAKTVINGLRNWLEKLEDMLDNAEVDHVKSHQLNEEGIGGTNNN